MCPLRGRGGSGFLTVRPGCLSGPPAGRAREGGRSPPSAPPARPLSGGLRGGPLRGQLDLNRALRARKEIDGSICHPSPLSVSLVSYFTTERGKRSTARGPAGPRATADAPQRAAGDHIPARQYQGTCTSNAGCSATVYTSYTVKKNNVILSASDRISGARGYLPLHTAL